MTATAMRVLLVEDNESLGRQLVTTLGAAGYEAVWIRRGDDALNAPAGDYCLVILDLMLPGASGFDVLAHFRRSTDVPVVVASSLADSYDKRRAYDLGASDYLTKPFWPQELLDRMALHLHHPPPSLGVNLAGAGGLAIDAAARRVLVDGLAVSLAPLEFDVLAALARRRGAAVSRAWLAQQVASRDTGPEAIDRCIAGLRKKLRRAGRRITTVWGVGYRLD